MHQFLLYQFINNCPQRHFKKMAASTSNSETQNGSDKKRIKFDEEIFRDVDKFPINFSGVPHIGERIFGYLDFEDFNSCRTVCKGWFNLLHGNRSSWIKLLEKEKVRKIKFMIFPLHQLKPNSKTQ